MSRKKLLKYEKLKNFMPDTIGDRINYIVANSKLTGKKFCELVEISTGNLSGLINDDSKPSSGFLSRILKIFKVNINWILTGEGSPYIEGEETLETLGVDMEMDRLLQMTRKVLESDTEYAKSLDANVRSFHKAIKTESMLKTQIQTMESRLNNIEKEMQKTPSEPLPEKNGTNDRGEF